MKLKLTREVLSETATLGMLEVDGEFYCDTLEPPISASDHPAIPLGKYKISLYPSRHFRRLCPLLEDVPGRSAILIHEGNFVKHTFGCILTGRRIDGEQLTDSKPISQVLTRWIRDSIKAGELVEIEII